MARISHLRKNLFYLTHFDNQILIHQEVLKIGNFFDNFLKILAKLILSVSTIYILGILWLGTLIGWDKPIIQLGVVPFLLAESFKIFLLAVITKKIIKFRKFI